MKLIIIILLLLITQKSVLVTGMTGCTAIDDADERGGNKSGEIQNIVGSIESKTQLKTRTDLRLYFVTT